MNHFFQAVNDFATIQNFNFEGAFAKIHRVIKVDNNLTVLFHRKNPFSTVVAARRVIENIRVVESDKHERFHSTRQLQRCNATQNGTLDDTGIHDVRSVNVLNHTNYFFARNLRIAIGIFKIHSGIIYSFRHIVEIDIQHSTLPTTD